MRVEKLQENEHLVELGCASTETKGVIGMLADVDQTPRQQSGISDE